MGYEKVSIRVVTDSTELLDDEQIWNNIINRCSKNPIFLSQFMRQLMKSCRAEGWTPMVFVVLVGDTIVGIAPLMTKRRLGVRFVRFLLKSSYSPDFIIRNHHNEIFLKYVLNFMFKILQCNFADFTLPAQSPNLRILKRNCRANGIRFRIVPEMGHRLLPVKCSWDEFEKSRGKKFRQEFRRIEKKLNQAGSWRVLRVENGSDRSVIQKILHVERMSWKEALRTQRGKEVDKALLMILEASMAAARVEPDFKWTVWFLELDGQILSYSLVLQYKKVAFIQKASYDERFKKLYPGKYVINAAIHELFNEKQIESIDFLTNLSFLRTWTSICSPRIRLFASQGRIFPTIAGFMFANVYVRRMLRVLNRALFY